MADDLTQPQQATGDDPISAYRAMYSPKTSTDKQIYDHLSVPNNYRAAFGSTQSTDDEITAHMQKFGMTRPDLVSPPGVSSPTQAIKPTPMAPRNTLEKMGDVDTQIGENVDAKEASGTSEGALTRFGKGVLKSAGLPTDQAGIENYSPSPAMLGGPVAMAAKMAYDKAKGSLGAMKEGIQEGEEAGQNIREGQPVVPNIIKAAYGGIHGALGESALGPAVEEAGKDITAHDYAGGAGGVTGVVGQVVAPEVIDAMGGKIYDASSGAKEIHGAVNPTRSRMNSLTGDEFAEPDLEFEGQVKRQLPRIKQFSQDQNVPIQTKSDLSKSAQGAANAMREKNNAMVEPYKNELFRTDSIPGYSGEQLSPGLATLDQLMKQWRDLNAQVDRQYSSGSGGIDTGLKVRSQAEVGAELEGLRNNIYGTLEAKTGLPRATLEEQFRSVPELERIAKTTSDSIAKETHGENALRNKKYGATSHEGLLKEGVNRAAQRLQKSPSDARIAKVFSNLNVAPYVHATPTIQPPSGVGGSELSSVSRPSPGPASNLSYVPQGGSGAEIPSALGSVRPTPTPPGAALGEVGPPGRVQAPALGRGGKSVPAPLSAALESVKPGGPTGAELQEPPFSYGYRQGDELGEADSITAGERQAERRFKTENPSALGRIPRTRDARAEATRTTPNPPPAKSNPSALGKIGEATKAARDAEEARLRARLAELQKGKEKK